MKGVTSEPVSFFYVGTPFYDVEEYARVRRRSNFFRKIRSHRAVILSRLKIPKQNAKISPFATPRPYFSRFESGRSG